METSTTETTVIVIATKDDEWKALEKIKKIVNALGENSYIGKAFDGVWEIAERNIDFDWGCSVRGYLDELHDFCDVCEYKDLDVARLENEISCNSAVFKEQCEHLGVLKQDLSAVTNRADCQSQMLDEKIAIIDDLRQQLATQSTEIVMLKAKLFDYMVRG